MFAFFEALQLAGFTGPFASLLADGWSWRSMFTGLNTQEGVVRLCILAVALGLFIITRK